MVTKLEEREEDSRESLHSKQDLLLLLVVSHNTPFATYIYKYGVDTYL